MSDEPGFRTTEESCTLASSKLKAEKKISFLSLVSFQLPSLLLFLPFHPKWWMYHRCKKAERAGSLGHGLVVRYQAGFMSRWVGSCLVCASCPVCKDFSQAL